MGKKPFPDLRHRDLPPKLFLHRGDLGPLEAARDDPLEVAKISLHVEGQSVVGDPPFHRNADRGDLPFFQPYAGPGRHPLCPKTETPESMNDYPLDLAQIAVHISPQSGSEIQQWVDHQLARAVIGRISAAAGAVDRNFSRAEQARIFTAPADGEDMGMLDQENDIREFFLLLELDKPLLERQRGRIFHLAQLFKKQRPHLQLQRQSLSIVPTQGFQERVRRLDTKKPPQPFLRASVWVE